MNLLKELLRALLNLLGGKKVADLDNDGKIETLHEEIKGVFSQFKLMNDKLTEVNEQLDEIILDEVETQKVEQARLQAIIDETNRRIAESNTRIQKVNSEIETNKKLQSKVSEFIV